MSTRVLTWVFYNVHMRASAKLVLLAIADNADDSGDNAWPSVGTLARKSSMDPRTVQRAIAELVRCGLLTVWRNAGRHGTNRYRINMVSVAGPVDYSTIAVDSAVDNAVDNRRSLQGGALPGVASEASAGDRSRHGGDSDATRTTNRTTITNPTTEGRQGRTTRSDEGQNLELDARRVLTELGTEWMLSAGQVDKLVPATLAALATGWKIDELIARLATHPAGVRSPVAVLTTRLRALTADGIGPRMSAPRFERPPWCGDDTCDPTTRIRDPGSGRALYRCPECHHLSKPTEAVKKVD